MPTLEQTPIRPIAHLDSHVLNVREAMATLRASEGLVAMFGLVVQIRSLSNGMRIELTADNQTLGHIEVIYLDGSAIVHPPQVEENYHSCGLEDGLRAVAVRLLHGHPVTYVDIR
jgi:hypothetical protein